MLYVVFEVLYAEKRIWLFFFCNVDQSVQISMKLELNVTRHLLDL